MGVSNAFNTFDSWVNQPWKTYEDATQCFDHLKKVAQIETQSSRGLSREEVMEFLMTKITTQLTSAEISKIKAKVELLQGKRRTADETRSAEAPKGAVTEGTDAGHQATVEVVAKGAFAELDKQLKELTSHLAQVKEDKGIMREGARSQEKPTRLSVGPYSEPQKSISVRTMLEAYLKKKIAPEVAQQKAVEARKKAEEASRKQADEPQKALTKLRNILKEASPQLDLPGSIVREATGSHPAQEMRRAAIAYLQNQSEENKLKFLEELYLGMMSLKRARMTETIKHDLPRTDNYYNQLVNFVNSKW